jgi:DNA polymerase III alpha subunit
MPPGQQVIEDYRHLHLSLKAHPVSFLRADLDARGIVRHDRLPGITSGKRVTIAGLVLVRQRPGTGNAIFMTLEDETAIANTILWPRTFERFRPIVMGARLISVTGELQNEKGVIHIIGERFEDLTPLLRQLSESPLVQTVARADEVKRPDPGTRSQKNADRRRALIRRATAARDDGAVAAVMPKGRNFH